jgi:carboxyl-terminal processing protease
MMAGAAKRWIGTGCLVLSVAACGGGGGGGDGGAHPATSSGWAAGVFLPSASFSGRCAVPRTGIDPLTNQRYADIQGTAVAENNWLRSWSNELYLWYDEIVDRDPASYGTERYFDLLKTGATTASGSSKDKFHFTYPTDEWRSLAQSGVAAGYGVEWAIVAALPPRRIVVAYTQPSSPATAPAAGLVRGEEVLQVDGVFVVSADSSVAVDAMLAGLYPSQPNETHEFTVRNTETGISRSFAMTSAVVTSVPVQNVKTVATTAGKVGYMLFNDHLATAEQALVTAVGTLRAAAIDDLVLDIRYNGGGYLSIASELAYMIAGTVPTAGQPFERLQFNAKHPSINPVTGQVLTPEPFHAVSLGFSTTAGLPLPTLDLPRVYVLTGGSTCSASESIINGLRGVNVEVIQIGSTTCGKPYGFYPADNCATTYFTIQFRGVNALGFGDYTDGFSPANMPGVAGTTVPGCSVADDFAHELGDPDEARFAAALGHRFGQSCPAPTGKSAFSSRPGGGLAAADAVVYKTPWLQNRTLGGP